MSEADGSRGPGHTLRGFGVPEKLKAPAERSGEAPEPPAEPIPNPASMTAEAAGRTTAPLAAPSPQGPPAQPGPSMPPAAPPHPVAPVARGESGAMGDGPIRVVCRRCQRTVWGWKLPFGVSCPMAEHHAHVNWFLVGVVASFWTAFVVVVISLLAIAG